MILSRNGLIIHCALSWVGWVVGFAGLCASGRSTASHSWWITSYNLVVILFQSIVVCRPNHQIFASLLLSLNSIGVIYNTQEVSFYMENDHRSTFYAVTAGYILLIVVQFAWLVVLGIPDEGSRRLKEETINDCLITTPVSPSSPADILNATNNNNEMTMAQHQSMLVNDAMNTIYVSPHAEFKIPVVALHAYGANPDDPNELSFDKGEILYVHDKKGSWWQAKKSDCSVGMIPSNYVTCTTSSGY